MKLAADAVIWVMILHGVDNTMGVNWMTLTPDIGTRARHHVYSIVIQPNATCVSKSCVLLITCLDPISRPNDFGHSFGQRDSPIFIVIPLLEVSLFQYCAMWMSIA